MDRAEGGHGSRGVTGACDARPASLSSIGCRRTIKHGTTLPDYDALAGGSVGADERSTLIVQSVTSAVDRRDGGDHGRQQDAHDAKRQRELRDHVPPA